MGRNKQTTLLVLVLVNDEWCCFRRRTAISHLELNAGLLAYRVPACSELRGSRTPQNKKIGRKRLEAATPVAGRRNRGRADERNHLFTA